MTIKIDQRRLKATKWPLAIAVAATISTPAQAFQFMLGEIEASLDTTLTAGASWRMDDRDTDQLGKKNLGPSLTDWSVGAVSVNSDDGNWNFEKGKTYSKILKGTSDLMLQYEDYGLFTRARYFYDSQLMDEEVAADENGRTRPLIKETLDSAGAGAEILDAFVWMDAELGDMPANFRLGKQVLGWGESTFLFGGASVINPIDAAAARAPGAEVKDVLLPVNMFYTSIGLTDAVTAEAFYQLEWDKTRSDPCGTFFSTNDAAADGCGPIWLSGGEGAELLGTDFASTRLDDKEASDDGQFGVALRWYAAELGDTEFGLYYINYHSRLPYGSFVINEGIGSDRIFSNYFIEYPEDLQSIALSFNTSTESGWSIGGEVSFKPNFPIARNGFEMTASSNAFLGNQSLSAYNEEARRIGKGGILKGYEEYDVYQAQMTFIKFFDQILGASRMTFVSEVGAIYVDSLPDNNRLGRNSAFGVGENPGYPGNTATGTDPAVASVQCSAGTNANPRFCNNDGFVTEVSAGYRMRASLEYSDVFAGINLTPTLIWSHDVLGYAPEPGGQFTEDARAIGFSLTGVYLSKYSATVGYTNFFGGGPYNVLNDRDNVSASVSVSF